MNRPQHFNFQQAIDELREALQLDFIGLALVDLKNYHHELKWRYVTGNLSMRYRKIVLSSGKGVAGIVFKTGKPMLVENIYDRIDEESLYNYPIVIFEKLKSFGAVPLFEDDHVQGVLLAGYREPDKLTMEVFERFQQTVGPKFGPFHHKERLSDGATDK